MRSRRDARVAQKQFALALSDYYREYTPLPLTVASVLLKVARCHFRTGSLSCAKRRGSAELDEARGDRERYACAQECNDTQAVEGYVSSVQKRERGRAGGWEGRDY